MPSIKLIERNACTGCGVCAAVCPVGCISMKPDYEGFFAPVVETAQCIDCSRCQDVCVAHIAADLHPSFAALLGKAQMPLATRSSSGGLAYCLACMIVEGGGVVVACAFDQDGNARYRAFETIEDLQHIQGSKYVQGEATAGYRLCSEHLRRGRQVLFIGMPCQAAAVRRLPNDKGQLLVVDVVCHGVPSSLFWQKDLSYQNARGRLLDRETIMFRSSNRRSRANFELYDNTKARVIPYERDAFFSAFMQGISFRESCYSCQFARRERTGDITIGDCASRDLYPSFHPTESVSAILINTLDGERLLNNLMERGWLDITEIDLETELKANGQLHAPSRRPSKRDTIYSDLEVLPYKEFVRRYREHVSVSWWMKRALKHLLPVEIRVRLRQEVMRACRRGR